MTKIYTLTLAPSLDSATQTPQIYPEGKLRCSAPVFEPGGGGINVARAVTFLGGKATAIFPIGGATGEHYITRNRAEWWDMLRRACGGGLVIAGTTLMKFAIGALGLSAFWGGFWAGMNYAVSFVMVQLLHWTVATKQPAMTAPAMAARQVGAQVARPVGRLPVHPRVQRLMADPHQRVVGVLQAQPAGHRGGRPAAPQRVHDPRDQPVV